MRNIVFALLMLAACKKPGGAGGAGSAAEESGDDLLTAKVNVYVGCLNSMNDYIHQSRNSYYEWAPPDTGPAIEKADSGVKEISRETTYGYDCFKRDGGLDAVDSIKVKNDALDKAGAAYKAALEGVMKQTKAAATYYDHKDWKDDKLAKGIAMHKDLVAAYSSFDTASHDLEAALEVIQDKMAADEMAQLEKDEGKKAHWQQRNTVHSAELFLRELQSEEKLDPAKLQTFADTYAKALADAQAWTDANKAEADKIVSWGNFVRYADEYNTQIKELFRALRDKQMMPESGDGSEDNILAKYNQLIELSNDLWN